MEGEAGVDIEKAPRPQGYDETELGYVSLELLMKASVTQ
jgi:hypothetical protein